MTEEELKLECVRMALRDTGPDLREVEYLARGIYQLIAGRAWDSNAIHKRDAEVHATDPRIAEIIADAIQKGQ